MARVRFPLDEHMPNALAAALRQRGIDVLTVSDAGLRGKPDTEILARSDAAGRVLVTRDRDYLRLHRQQYQHAGIAYCGRSIRSIGRMVGALVVIYEVFDSSNMVNQVEYL